MAVAGPALAATAAPVPSADDVTPQMLGARGDGAADDTAAIQAAIDRARSRGGGVVRIPAGTYRITRPLRLAYQVSLIGEGMSVSILRLDAPADAIVIDEAFNLGQRIEALCLRSNHERCQSAIRAPRSHQGLVNVLIKEVLVNSTDPQRMRWEHGLFAENLQNSLIQGLYVYYAAATGIRLAFGCNANTFVGCEVVGLTARSRRGIDQSATAADRSGDLIFEDYWYGLTLQGNFHESAWRAHSVSPKVFGCHVENTFTAPADGADIVLSGGMVNASFAGMEGGSLKATGLIRNLALSSGQMNDIELGANVWAVLSAMRYGALSAHRDAKVTSVGCSTTGGVQRPNPSMDAVNYVSVAPRITGSDEVPAAPQSEVVIFANTARTTIRGLSGGLEGQRLVCLVGANTTFVGGGNLRLAGELRGGAGVTLTLCFIDGWWYETARSPR